jgi:hypothetical protein
MLQGAFYPGLPCTEGFAAQMNPWNGFEGLFGFLEWVIGAWLPITTAICPFVGADPEWLGYLFFWIQASDFVLDGLRQGGSLEPSKMYCIASLRIANHDDSFFFRDRNDVAEG